MNRRLFLRLLTTAAPVAVIKPTYFFAPRNGWSLTEGGVWANNSGGSAGLSVKTPEEILADFNEMLTQAFLVILTNNGNKVPYTEQGIKLLEESARKALDYPIFNHMPFAPPALILRLR